MQQGCAALPPKKQWHNANENLCCKIAAIASHTAPKRFHRAATKTQDNYGFFFSSGPMNLWRSGCTYSEGDLLFVLVAHFVAASPKCFRRCNPRSSIPEASSHSYTVVCPSNAVSSQTLYNSNSSVSTPTMLWSSFNWDATWLTTTNHMAVIAAMLESDIENIKPELTMLESDIENIKPESTYQHKKQLENN